MPDENKLQSLVDAMFQVKRTCYRCAHFDEGAGGWGTCRKIAYDHKKHTGPERQASVPVDGWCPQHEARLESEALLGGHRDLIEKPGLTTRCACGQPGTTIIDRAVFCYECTNEVVEAQSAPLTE